MKNIINTTKTLEKQFVTMFDSLQNLTNEIVNLRDIDEKNKMNVLVYEQMIYMTNCLNEDLSSIASKELSHIRHMHQFREYFTKFYLEVLKLQKTKIDNIQIESNSDFDGLIITNPITKQVLKVEIDFRRSFLNFTLNKVCEDNHEIEELIISIQVSQYDKLYCKTWENGHMANIANYDMDAQKLFDKLLEIIENKPSDFITLFNKNNKLTTEMSADTILENLIKLSGTKIMEIELKSDDKVDDIYAETRVFFDKFEKDDNYCKNCWANANSKQLNLANMLTIDVENDKIIISDAIMHDNDDCNFHNKPSTTIIEKQDNEFVVYCDNDADDEILSSLNCNKFISKFVNLLQVASTEENWQQLIQDNLRWYDYANNDYIEYADMLLDFTNR